MGEIVMPRLSDTMEEGTILRWLSRDGEHVTRGSELVEIETDKAAMTYESDQEGTLEIVAPEGATLAVGELIARVAAGASAPASPAAPAEASPNGQRRGEPAPERTPQAAPERAPEPAPVQPQPAGQAPAVAPAHESSGERVRASPLARRLAQDSGVDLQGLSGSGPGGRIVKADVLGAGAARASVSATAPQAAVLEGVATAKGQTTIVELTRTQGTIARRMAESKATIPDFSLQMDVDMEACVTLRAELKQLSGAAGAAVPTYNDMVVKAAALALREHPRANGSYRDGHVQLHSRVNVGVAVAAQDALVVPTVFDADEKSLGEIAREARALVERVRDGTITPPELGGGTFTVSNLGMYGIRSFTAIINPPQAAIMSVGELQPRAVADGDQLRPRRMLTLTLVCDHRILYGADAAVFLGRIRELLQTPASLTL
jgi:pyruvate dehydrogenase E2 component (dihydrolipoamide acetyltransferase)